MFVIVSLFINLVLCFKEILVVVLYILLIVIGHHGLIGHLLGEM
jgi:hypothetical protein